MEVDGVDSEPPDKDNPSGFGPFKRKSADLTSNIHKKKVGHDDTPSASYQNIYTHPDFSEKKKYSDSDKGPFIIHLKRTEPDPSSGYTIRPVKIGHILSQNKVCNIEKQSISNLGRNRVSIAFKTASDANNFIDSSFLAQYKLSAVVPTFNVTRMGVVRGIPTDISMEELVSESELPQGRGEIIKARRLYRKVKKGDDIEWVATQTIVLTFSGQELPSHLYCFYTSIPVETYLLPSIQCLKCCRFGHVKAQCRSRPRCFKCSKEHTGDNCVIDIPTCLFCSANHFATDKSCPEHSRQKGIKLVMSQENVSYLEASARFPAVRRPYSDVAAPLRTSSLSTSSQQLPSIPPVSSASQSYRKTVFRNNPIRPVTNSVGYDKVAHSNIIRTPTSSIPNGHAIQANLSPNDNLLENLVSSISDIIGKFDDIHLPFNVKNKLDVLFQKIYKIQSPPHPSVELSEHQEQEI